MTTKNIALLYKLLKRSVFFILLLILVIGFFTGCSDRSNHKKKILYEKQLSKNIFDSITTANSFSEIDKTWLRSKISSDSIHAELIFDLSYYYYKNSDSSQFRYWNDYAKNLGVDDKLILGEANWDLGNFFYRENVIDSSYYHYYRAYKFYEEIQNEYYAARMMLNMAILQENVKDYIGSEVTTINAIEVFEKLDKKKQLYIAYSNLGIVFNGLNQYNQAIEYHKKAITIAEKINDYELEATSLNNLGVVHEHKKTYDSAVYYYNRALKIDEIVKENPRVYAMLLDNLAFSKFKISPKPEFIDLSQKALKIRDSIEHTSGQLINNLHIAEMESDLGREDSAFKILTETRKRSEINRNYDYLLSSLIMLSEVNPSASSEYFEVYHNLNDSLVNEERLVRNKFARIRFETDEYIEENKILSQQQVYLGSVFIVCIVLGLLLFYQKELRAKNNELRFEKEQQIANEKIYGLLLNEQARMEEARGQERNRISEELHDGVLGKLFATRISLSLLGHKLFSIVPEKKEVYQKHIFEIQTVEKEIRSISHDLKNDFIEDNQTFLLLIKDLMAKTEMITEIQIHLESDANIAWEKLSNDHLINLYRVLQEAIQNTIKHSKAKNLTIQFLEDNGYLKFLIMDDGSGFKKNNKKGVGLKNMRKRVEKLNGKLHIESSLEGTILSIQIPLSDFPYEK